VEVSVLVKIDIMIMDQDHVQIVGFNVTFAPGQTNAVNVFFQIDWLLVEIVNLVARIFQTVKLAQVLLIAMNVLLDIIC
jgi:hypothetical protein